MPPLQPRSRAIHQLSHSISESQGTGGIQSTARALNSPGAEQYVGWAWSTWAPRLPAGSTESRTAPRAVPQDVARGLTGLVADAMQPSLTCQHRPPPRPAACALEAELGSVSMSIVFQRAGC